MLIYADTNIYCRSFDDKLNQRIELEAEACAEVFFAIDKDHHDLLGSDVLLYEFRGVNDIKRRHIQQFIGLCSGFVPLSPEMEARAEEFVKEIGLSDRDALHLASALIGKADVVLTCDDRFLNKAKKIQLGGIAVYNPLIFVSTIL